MIPVPRLSSALRHVVRTERHRSRRDPQPGPSRRRSPRYAGAVTALTPPSASAPRTTVLLVDDEAGIRSTLGSFLERSGHRVLLASDGVEALDLLAGHPIDIVVTDVLMPRMDGRELVRRVRAHGTWVPIILLTQVDASYERVSALDEGADDYLSKPFDPAELASRIRAVLRRSQGVSQPLTTARQLVCGSLVLDRESRRVELGGREVALTPKAVTLLDYLMSHPGELHTRDALLSALWGIDFSSSTRAVDHRVREIRRVLGDDAAEPTYIETVPSVGYRFCGQVHR